MEQGAGCRVQGCQRRILINPLLNKNIQNKNALDWATNPVSTPFGLFLTRTYINRRNQELGSRAGPGPGPGPVQCRAMQRAATAAN